MSDLLITLTGVMILLVILLYRTCTSGQSSPVKTGAPQRDVDVRDVALEEWDAYPEMQQLIEQTKELRTLYGKLGYSPEVARKSRQLINELKALIRAKISDFPAFQQALQKVHRRFEEEPGRFKLRTIPS